MHKRRSSPRSTKTDAFLRLGSRPWRIELHADIDATSPKHLRDKYAIVGIGETAYMRGSGITTRALGTWAVRNAIADAGLTPADIDGMLSYHFVLGDSTYVPQIAGDLGIRLDFHMDVQGGGASTEALVGVAMGVDRSRHVQVRRDLPCRERVLPGPLWRRRRACNRTSGERHAARPCLWHAQRRQPVRLHVHAAHVRLRNAPGAGRCGPRDPQRARVQQPEGILQKAGQRRRCA